MPAQPRCCAARGRSESNRSVCRAAECSRSSGPIVRRGWRKYEAPDARPQRAFECAALACDPLRRDAPTFERPTLLLHRSLKHVLAGFPAAGSRDTRRGLFDEMYPLDLRKRHDVGWTKWRNIGETPLVGFTHVASLFLLRGQRARPKPVRTGRTSLALKCSTRAG